jgi:hypothetical protein
VRLRDARPKLSCNDGRTAPALDVILDGNARARGDAMWDGWVDVRLGWMYDDDDDDNGAMVGRDERWEVGGWRRRQRRCQKGQ